MSGGSENTINPRSKDPNEFRYWKKNEKKVEPPRDGWVYPLWKLCITDINDMFYTRRGYQLTAENWYPYSERDIEFCAKRLERQFMENMYLLKQHGKRKRREEEGGSE